MNWKSVARVPPGVDIVLSCRSVVLSVLVLPGQGYVESVWFVLCSASGVVSVSTISFILFHCDGRCLG